MCLLSGPFGVLWFGLVVGHATFLNGSWGVLWLGVVVRCATLLNRHATLLNGFSCREVVRMVSLHGTGLACLEDQIIMFGIKMMVGVVRIVWTGAVELISD
jgi:hypothetical protein